MFSGGPDRAPWPGDSPFPPGASYLSSPAGASPFDSFTSASRGLTSSV